MKIKPLTPNRNNIETYLPIFNGFYESCFDPEFYGEAEHFGLPDNFDFSAFFNYSDYYNALSKYFCNCVENEMSDFIERIDFQRLHSPKYYNFENDAIYCIIRPKKHAIKEYVLTNADQFNEYLKDNLTSCSGFISHHSNRFDDWAEMTNNFTRFDAEKDSKGFNLGFVLSFIAKNEGLEEMDVFDDYNAYVFASEFLSQEFYDMVNELESSEFVKKDAFIEAKQSGNLTINVSSQIEAIKQFVKDNYTNPNVIEMTVNEYAEIDTGFYTPLSEILNIDRIAQWQINEIEKHTLQLSL